MTQFSSPSGVQRQFRFDLGDYVRLRSVEHIDVFDQGTMWASVGARCVAAGTYGLIVGIRGNLYIVNFDGVLSWKSASLLSLVSPASATVEH